MIYIGLFIIFVILILINIIKYKKYKEQYKPNQIQQVNVRPEVIPLTSQQ